MSWISKIVHGKIRTETIKAKKAVPDGVWDQCAGCNQALYREELERNCWVCSKCQHHHRIGARERLLGFLDTDSTQEIAGNIVPIDALKFKDTKRYDERLKQAQDKTQETDALIAMKGTLNQIPVMAVAFEFDFLGGSMGSVVGERFVQAINYSLAERRPLICFSASGGARMQESLFSLMQMAKISAALGKLRQQCLPYIVVLADPTTGGVSASLAMLGDIHVAEPKALIGFAGPRVIEQTVREKLPEGFQRSEFVQEKGMVDMIVDRRKLRREVTGILSKLLKLMPESAVGVI